MTLRMSPPFIKDNSQREALNAEWLKCFPDPHDRPARTFEGCQATSATDCAAPIRRTGAMALADHPEFENIKGHHHDHARSKHDTDPHRP